MNGGDLLDEVRMRVEHAGAARAPLCIQGSGSKTFYGRDCTGEPLALAGHRGVIDYEPSELVLTARAGTPLAVIEALLAEQHQMLAFEPPHFGAGATLGGTIACGLSGPRRPHAGAVRDFVLGARIVNGTGEALNFGGRVMKNVAGYDLSRLMAGALGTLGVLMDISLKVLPRPETERTLRLALPLERALAQCRAWAATPMPLSATAWHAGALTVRLSGADASVRQAAERVGGDVLADGDTFWRDLREQTHAFFAGDAPLWRISVPPDTPAYGDDWLYEWGGALRWYRGDTSVEALRRTAKDGGGAATWFRHGARDAVFQPLDGALERLHRRIKQALDPAGILNPGRLYRDL